MTQGLIKCGSCGTEMIREYPDSKKKLRASIIIFQGGKCVGKCRKCGTDVVLPITFNLDESSKRKKRPIHIVFPVDRK